MVRLCLETASSLYDGFTSLQVNYREGSRPLLEAVLSEIRSACPNESHLLSGIVDFTARLAGRAEQDLDRTQVGGTEEEIIARGSDWCADVARVACILYQMAGFPARLAYLFDLDQAYYGHVIVELYYRGKWGAADSSTGIVYREAGSPASVWQLMNDPALVLAHRNDPREFYSTPGQFRAAGLANYLCTDFERFDYSVSGLNVYYHSILDMCNRGWPGGIRWLHGEDEQPTGR
jgi:hypothetical protein